MRKDKLIIIITIGIMSLLLSSIMFAQFKVVNETDIAQIENMREEELEEAITDWKEKYTIIEEKLKDVNEKIIEYQESIESNNETNELVKKELLEAQKLFGLTEVNGEGIIVTLTDNSENSYEALDFLELVNELRLAGAEAISINNERIVNTTDIVEVGTNFIVINNNKITSPYTIKAIGDSTYLKSALTIKKGYYDQKQKNNYNIEIQEKVNIRIEKYSKDISLKYIELK